MRGSRKFCQRGSNCNNVFFLSFFIFDEGRKDPSNTISGPSLARQRNAILMVCRWRANYGPTLNADSLAFDFLR